jgi:2-methylcitrate dehydratase PrpD
MRNMTEPAAEFISSVTYEEMPRRGVELAVDAMTDCAGVALAGSAEPIAQKLLCVLGSSGPARAIGTDVRLSWGDAALYNGTVAHAIDYDDTTHPAYAHPSSHILPALLSLGQYRHSTGRDLIGAYIVGLEIESKLGHAYNIEHYGRGWHTTGTFGPIAAAAAGAQLLRLDRAGTAAMGPKVPVVCQPRP